MEQGILLWIAILFPFLTAILLCLTNSYKIRCTILTVAAVVMALNSLLLFNPAVGDFQSTPSGGFFHQLIIVLDFLLLAYILYVGIARKHALVIIFAVLQLLPMAYFEYVLHAHTDVAPAFYVDTLTKIMIAIISIIGSIICIYGVKYIREHEEHLKLEKSRQGRFLFWTVLFLGAMNGLVASNNLYYLYFFWEVTTVCSFLLIGHDATKEALKNATRALWMNSFGGVTFCFAIIYLYTYCGHEQGLSLLNILKGDGLNAGVLLPLSLLCFTAFTKSAQFPFQSWLLGAMVAPTPVSALLHSSTMVKAGVYLVVRVMPAFSPEATGKIGAVISIMIAFVGAFSFLMGSILAISQTTGKKVLAYSTIAYLGLIIFCAGINTPLSLTAAIFIIIFHALSKALLFLCAGTVESVVHSREIDDMQGLVVKAPVLATIMSIGILSMFLPPFGMLFSKWISFEALATLKVFGLESGFWLVKVKSFSILIFITCALASAATMVFWTKWLGMILQRNPGVAPLVKEKLSRVYMTPLWILLIGVVLLSLGIGPFYKLVVADAVNNVLPLAATYSSSIYANLIQIGITGISQEGSLMPQFEGLYPVLALFLLLGGLIVPWIVKKVKISEISPAYICGEHIAVPADAATATYSDEFMSVGDKKTKLQITNFYYAKYFSESVLNPAGNIIATVLMALMLGIVMGVTLL